VCKRRGGLQHPRGVYIGPGRGGKLKVYWSSRERKGGECTMRRGSFWGKMLGEVRPANWSTASQIGWDRTGKEKRLMIGWSAGKGQVL